MGVLAHLEALAMNLWWSWDSEATLLWPSLDPGLWEQCSHNPVALLASLGDAKRAEVERDDALATRVAAIHDRFQGYLSADTWASKNAPEVQRAGVAYLSMEFGLHESLPLYSGGLGVLAGDHVRSASDLGVALVGVGLLWREGYFRQALVDGQQVASYTALDVELSPLQRVRHDEGDVEIEVPIAGTSCRLAVWRLDVGRVALYLLDADHPANADELRALTSRLYGGNHATRIRQEALLGLGAIRLLRALGHHAHVVHMNEGHCAFAPLQLVADELGPDPDVARWKSVCDQIRERLVFTTHTPVPAGHDRFGWSDVNGILGRWRDSLGLPKGAFMDLGRVRPHDLDEPLCMTVLALRMSATANGVSRLHGEVSRQMWAEMWPERDVAEVPITHITNGVHPMFWVAQPSRALFDRYLPGWREDIWNPAIWAGVDAIDDDEIRAMRDQNRTALVDLVRERTGTQLDPHRLTIGFARRFAPYKRGDLLFDDPERLAAWLERGAQVVIAGKAHPADVAGQEIVARVAAFAADPRFAGRVVFVPDYDIVIGRVITAGADVWLNNPRRPHEASGTSGQKVVYNGGLNLSVLDGWWDEGYDGSNGWAIGDGQQWDEMQATDRLDAADLYRLLEDEVWPEWEARSVWCARVRRSLKVCAPAFSSHRMVRDYVLDLYRPRC